MRPDARPGTTSFERGFWVYGWAPGMLRIDAASACGGLGHVKRAETERSFAQGLIAMFAGYYINIYSPYTARVVCDHPSRAVPGPPIHAASSLARGPAKARVLQEARRCLRESEDGDRYTIEELSIATSGLDGASFTATIDYIVAIDRSGTFESTREDLYLLPLGEVSSGVLHAGRFRLSMRHTDVNVRQASGRAYRVIKTGRWTRTSCERARQ